MEKNYLEPYALDLMRLIVNNISSFQYNGMYFEIHVNQIA